MQKTIITLAIIIGIIFLYIAGNVPIREEYAYICENTGSHRFYKKRFFVIEKSEIKQSELQKFLHKKQITYQYRWVSYSGTEKFIAAGTITGHQKPSQIFVLRFEEFNRFIKQCTDKQKLEIFRILQKPDTEARDAEINKHILYEYWGIDEDEDEK